MDRVRIGIGLTLRYVAGVLMALMVFSAITAIFTLPLTEVIGYDVYVANEEAGRSELVYTHYFADGEDARLSEYEARGLTVFQAELRSQLSGAEAGVLFAIAQGISLVLFIGLVPNRLYRLGAACREAGEPHRAADWLFPTLFPAAISLAGYVLLVLSKVNPSGFPGLSLYRYANYHFYGLLRLILGTGNDASLLYWGQISAALLPTALTVLLCALGYEFGYRGIHPIAALKNKIKYKRDT